MPLFYDNAFPLSATDHKGRRIEWKRPKEICSNPIFVDEYGIDDIRDATKSKKRRF